MLIKKQSNISKNMIFLGAGCNTFSQKLKFLIHLEFYLIAVLVGTECFCETGKFPRCQAIATQEKNKMYREYS